jgi:hypothetical protein
MKKLFRTNKLFLLIIVVFLLLNNLPYLVGAGQTLANKNLIYNGAPPLNRADYFVYLSQIELGRQGHLFMKNLYNHESQTAVFLSPQWYIIGQFGKLTNLNNAFSYHIWRLLASLLFITVLWWWLKNIFSTYKQRILALLIVLFSNGLGHSFVYFFPDSKIWPTNLWITESITFLNLTQNPVAIISSALLLLIFGLFIKAQTENNKRLFWWLALLTAWLVLIHPYDGFIVALLPTLWLFIKNGLTKKNLINLGYLYVPLCLVAIYYFFIFISDLPARQWLQQNQVISGNIGDYLWGLGLLVPLSLGGLIILIKNKNHCHNFLLFSALWAGLGWLLIYLPLDFNRRLSNGWSLSLAIMATFFLLWLDSKTKSFGKTALIYFVILLLLGETFLGTFLSIKLIYRDPDRRFFYTPTEQTVYTTIKKITPPDSIILTRDIDGTILPTFTGRKVYAGHLIQTWKNNEKNKLTQLIWTSQENIKSWLIENKIDYIFASRQNIPEFEQLKWLAKESYITPLLDNAEFIFYKVKK